MFSKDTMVESQLGLYLGRTDWNDQLWTRTFFKVKEGKGMSQVHKLSGTGPTMEGQRQVYLIPSLFRVRPALMQRYLTLEVLSHHGSDRQGLPNKTGPLQKVRTAAPTSKVTNRIADRQQFRIAIAVAFFNMKKKISVLVILSVINAHSVSYDLK